MRSHPKKLESKMKINTKNIESKAHLLQFFQEKPEGYLNVLNYLFGLANCHGTMYPSHAHIAEVAGISERHAERITRILQEECFISKERRPYTSCIFRINHLFYNPYIREKLKSIFKAFRWLPLIILMSAYSRSDEENYADVGVLNYINYNIYISTVYGCINTLRSNTSKRSNFEDRLRRPDLTSKMYSTKKVEPYFKKRELEMEKKVDILPGSVKNTGLRLALNGQIELSIFPEKALKYALSCCAKKALPTTKARFFYIRSVCASYCKEHGLAYYPERLKDLRAYYGIQSTDPFVEEGLHKIPLQGEGQRSPTNITSVFVKTTVPIETKRVIDNDPNAEHISFYKCTRPVEDPIIAYAKALSFYEYKAARSDCCDGSRTSAFHNVIPKPKQPIIDDPIYAYYLVEQYRKTPECAWSEKRFGYTLINPFKFEAQQTIMAAPDHKPDKPAVTHAGADKPAYVKTSADKS